MYMQWRFRWLMLCGLGHWAWASEPKLVLPDEAAGVNTLQQSTKVAQQPQQVLNVSETDLLANPDLLHRALDSAVATGQTDALRVLIPIYRQLPSAQQNMQLRQFAEAALAMADGQTKQAIAYYRAMIAEDPSLQPVRLQLGLALMRDHQNAAAKDQLQRLRGENIPESVQQLIDQALAAIAQRESWSFTASGYYTHERNINGAPDIRERTSQHCPGGITNCRVTFPEQQSADGIHLNLSADKQIPLNGNWYANIGGNANLDWYWNAHDFDDVRLRIHAGLGYQNARFDTSVAPFFSRQIYADKGYARTAGVDINASYWLNNQWRLSTMTELAYARHDMRPWLDGNRLFVSANVLYVANAGRYFYGGMQGYHSDARDDYDRFNRYGMNVGWVEDWAKGISSRLSSSIARRLYDGIDPMAGIIRRDTEYRIGAQFWHRDWYVWGITPKFTVDWKKTSSNHFYYDRQRGEFNAYIELSKTF